MLHRKQTPGTKYLGAGQSSPPPGVTIALSWPTRSWFCIFSEAYRPDSFWGHTANSHLEAILPRIKGITLLWKCFRRAARFHSFITRLFKAPDSPKGRRKHSNGPWSQEPISIRPKPSHLILATFSLQQADYAILSVKSAGRYCSW